MTNVRELLWKTGSIVYLPAIVAILKKMKYDVDYKKLKKHDSNEIKKIQNIIEKDKLAREAIAIITQLIMIAGIKIVGVAFSKLSTQYYLTLDKTNIRQKLLMKTNSNPILFCITKQMLNNFINLIELSFLVLFITEPAKVIASELNFASYLGRLLSIYEIISRTKYLDKLESYILHKLDVLPNWLQQNLLTTNDLAISRTAQFVSRWIKESTGVQIDTTSLLNNKSNLEELTKFIQKIEKEKLDLSLEVLKRTKTTNIIYHVLLQLATLVFHKARKSSLALLVLFASEIAMSIIVPCIANRPVDKALTQVASAMKDMKKQ